MGMKYKLQSVKQMGGGKNYTVIDVEKSVTRSAAEDKALRVSMLP